MSGCLLHGREDLLVGHWRHHLAGRKAAAGVVVLDPAGIVALATALVGKSSAERSWTQQFNLLIDRL